MNSENDSSGEEIPPPNSLRGILQAEHEARTANFLASAYPDATSREEKPTLRESIIAARVERRLAALDASRHPTLDGKPLQSPDWNLGSENDGKAPHSAPLLP